MKTVPSFLLQFALCAALAVSVCAQSPDNAAAAAPGEPKQETPISERRFNVEFESMKLTDAMEVIRAQLPDLNVVVPPALGTTPLGKLKLRNITVEGLVEAIRAATDGSISGMYDGAEYLTFVRSDGAPVQQETICRVLSLRQYLVGKKDDEINRAIEDLTQVVLMARDQLDRARSGAARSKAPEFSVHPSTKLLIVVGSPESVALVEEVVTAVTGTPVASRPVPGIPGMEGAAAPGFAPGTLGAAPGGFGGGGGFSAEPGAGLPGSPAPQKPALQRR